MKTETYYSIPEAAKTCGVSRTTLWKWVKSGRIHAFITPGGHHRILREEMDRFMEENVSPAFVRPATHSIPIVDGDPRQSCAEPNPDIVFRVDGYAGESLKTIQEGADDSLPKTVDFNTVTQRIEALLGTEKRR